MEIDKLRIGICEHTNKLVVQEKFIEEWLCIHDETEEEELENIIRVMKLIKNK